jgi:hypothetical protein
VLASDHAYGCVAMFMGPSFPFMQAYYILDEILIAGELQESSKKNVARLIAAQVCKCNPHIWLTCIITFY